MSKKNKLQRIGEAVRLILTEVDKEELAEHQVEQWRLEDGQTIIEADPFEAGANVFIVTEDERIPLPVGDYKTDDGKMVVVQEDGVIFEIKDAGQEEAPEEQKEVEQEEEKSTAKKIVESISKETHFTKEEKEALELEIVELKKALELSKEAKKGAEVDLAEAIATKEKVELELSKKPTAKKIANAPASNKKQINFNSQAKTAKGRILEGLQHLTKQ